MVVPVFVQIVPEFTVYSTVKLGSGLLSQRRTSKPKELIVADELNVAVKLVEAASLKRQE